MSGLASLVLSSFAKQFPIYLRCQPCILRLQSEIIVIVTVSEMLSADCEESNLVKFRESFICESTFKRENYDFVLPAQLCKNTSVDIYSKCKRVTGGTINRQL